MKLINFQYAVMDWATRCFGADIVANKKERAFRFFEEATELFQATGCSKEEALHLINYVYSRPIGELTQEVGGVMTTLSALCGSNNISLEDSACAELQRINTKVEEIREKQKTKPHGLPSA